MSFFAGTIFVKEMLETLSLYLEQLSKYEENEKYEIRIEFEKKAGNYEFGKISLVKKPYIKIPGF